MTAVGTNGAIQNWNGSAWTSATSPTTNPLYGIWGAVAGDAWAVGATNTLLHFGAGGWSLDARRR